MTITNAELQQQIEELQAKHAALEEALKLLLPLALTVPATTQSSAQALHDFQTSLREAEEASPRSEEFWYLAISMSLMLSSRALAQHPSDETVAATFQGLRAHRRQ